MSKIKGSQNQADSTNRDNNTSIVDTEKQSNSTTELVINPPKSPESSIIRVVNVARPIGKRITVALRPERNNIQLFTNAETHPSQRNYSSTSGQAAANHHVVEPQQNIPQLFAAAENKSSEVQPEGYHMIIDDSVVENDKPVNE